MSLPTMLLIIWTPFVTAIAFILYAYIRGCRRGNHRSLVYAHLPGCTIARCWVCGHYSHSYHKRPLTSQQ